MVDNLDKHSKIIITGGAGFVGTNLAIFLFEQGFNNVTLLDKNESRLSEIKSFFPKFHLKCCDISQFGDWEEDFHDCDILFLNHACITANSWKSYEKNTLDSTKCVISVAERKKVRFTVLISAMAVHLNYDYGYPRLKKYQERMMVESNLNFCVMRPYQMFGWFDFRNLYPLICFLKKYPMFPMPGNGQFPRQLLYVRDFCKILLWAADTQPIGANFDVVGSEEMTYIEIIQKIKTVFALKTPIVHLPLPIFRFLFNLYLKFDKKSLLMPQQLDTLISSSIYSGEPWKTFGFSPTQFDIALNETYNHPLYSNISCAQK